MKRQRRTKIMTIVALVVAIAGMSLGFAAFTNTLIISSSANVKPDSASFSVLFSSSNTSQLISPVSGVGSGNATGANASISGTTISGLKANFTEPGQTVTYTFYAHNVGSYLAYLRNIDFGSGKSCTAVGDTTNSLVQAACDDITISVRVGTTNTSVNKTVSNHSLAVDAYESVVVTISYASGGARADGEFNISFGDVTLTYSSADGEAGLISFTVDGTAYSVIEGTTWAAWADSEEGKCIVAHDGTSEVCVLNKLMSVTPYEEIIADYNYTSVSAFCSSILPKECVSPLSE